MHPTAPTTPAISQRTGGQSPGCSPQGDDIHLADMQIGYARGLEHRPIMLGNERAPPASPAAPAAALGRVEQIA